MVNKDVYILGITTHASCTQSAGRVISGCDYLFVSVCAHAEERKTARAINTKLVRNMLYDSRSACIDPEVKRSKVKVTQLSNVLLVRVFVPVGLLRFSSFLSTSIRWPSKAATES